VRWIGAARRGFDESDPRSPRASSTEGGKGALGTRSVASVRTTGLVGAGVAFLEITRGGGSPELPILRLAHPVRTTSAPTANAVIIRISVSSHANTAAYRRVGGRPEGSLLPNGSARNVMESRAGHGNFTVEG
jgi:hypothetical protein